MKISIPWIVVEVIVAAGISAGATYWGQQSQISTLESANQELNISASKVSELE